MPLVESIKQGALEMGTRGAAILVHELGARGILQPVKAVEAELCRQRVIHLCVQTATDLLHSHVKHCRLACQLICRVIVWECDADLLAASGLRARQLLFKARNERTRSDHKLSVLGCTTLECHTINSPDKVDEQLVAILRIGTFPLRFIGALLAGQPLEGLHDHVIGDVGDRTYEGNLRCIRQRELRHQVDAHRDDEILLAVEHLLDFALDLDAGRHRRAQRAFLDGLLGHFGHCFLDNLPHHRLAERLAQMRDGHLAGAEPLEAHLSLHVLKLCGQAGIQIVSGNGDAEFAAKAFIHRFSNVHCVQSCSVLRGACHVLQGQREWCGRRDLNPHDLRHWNLNPARLPVSPRPRGFVCLRCAPQESQHKRIRCSSRKSRGVSIAGPYRNSKPNADHPVKARQGPGATSPEDPLPPVPAPPICRIFRAETPLHRPPETLAHPAPDAPR